MNTRKLTAFLAGVVSVTSLATYPVMAADNEPVKA